MPHLLCLLDGGYALGVGVAAEIGGRGGAGRGHCGGPQLILLCQPKNIYLSKDSGDKQVPLL